MRMEQHMSKRQRRITRREFGTDFGGGWSIRGSTGDPARPESQRQAEHRVHRVRRARQREPQRAHDHAGPPARGRAPARRRRRIRTRTSSSSATSTRTPIDAAAQRFPQAKKFTRLPEDVRQAERLRRRRGLDGRAHARVRDLPGADARQARLLREAAHLQHLGSAAHPRARREVPEAVDADGQPGACVADAAQDQGDPEYRRHRSGARGARVGRARVGTPGRGVRREVRQAARLLQRRPDRRSVQGRNADPGHTTTGICGWDPRRRGRSTRPTSRDLAGTAGGMSATGR